MKKIIYILISIVLGVLYGGYFNSYLLNISFLFCIICCYLVFFKKNPKLKKYNRIYFFLVLIVFFSFYTTYRYRRYDNFFKENINNIECICEILYCEKDGERYNKYLGLIKNIQDKSCNYKVYIYLSDKKEYKYGDVIKGNMKIEKPSSNRNDGGFNNKMYYYSNNIYANCYIEKIYDVSSKNNFLTYIYDIKNNIIKNFFIKFEDKTGLLISMIFGDDRYLSKNEKEIFSNSNLSHILVVSGSHLGFLLVFSKYFFQRLNFQSKIIDIANICIIIMYLILNNFSLSLLRASIMYIISIIYKMRDKNKNNLKIVLELIIIFLIFNPLYIYNVSLLLSFVCIIAIQLLNKKIENKFQYNLNEYNNKLLSNIIQNVSVSFTVQLVIIPILSMYFHKVYITSILSSIFAIPISSLIIFLGIIFSIVSFIPILSDSIYIVLNFLIIILKCIAVFFSTLPFSNVNVFPLRWYEVLIYYFVLYTLLISNYLYFSIKFYLKNIYFRIIRKNKIIKLCLLLLLLIIIWFILTNNNLKIDFIDVGQGDSICVRVCGKNILIDGGNSTDNYDNGKNNIIPFLLYNRVDKIDYVIISHFDADHINGLITVINEYKVNNLFIAQNIDVKSEDYINFINKVNLNKVSVKIIKNNDRIYFSKNVFLDFYTTDENTYIKDNSSNNNSLICKLNYYSFKAIFMGDAEDKQENVLLNNNSDLSANVLKIAHHGSKSSTTDEFLNEVNPQIAVIQVGKNFYGHPNEEVLNRLQNKGCIIYRNDINGQISLKINKYGKINIKTKFK